MNTRTPDTTTMSIYSVQEARFRNGSKDEIYVEAIIQDAVYIKGSQTLIDPPEYGPGLFKTTISSYYFPEDVELEEDNLQELIGLHIDLNDQEWVAVDTSDY